MNDSLFQFSVSERNFVSLLDILRPHQNVIRLSLDTKEALVGKMRPENHAPKGVGINGEESLCE